MAEPIDARPSDRFGLAALAAVGLAGALLNLDIVRELAIAAGYSDLTAWLYWLILDFFAVIAMRGALRAQSVEVRRWAGASSVLALALSAMAAGLHVFIENDELPDPVAFAVLCLPALMVGLSLHLVLLMTLEGTSAEAPTEGAEEVESIELTECVTERISHRSAAVERRREVGTKTARFIEALRATEIDDPRKVVDVVAELNRGIDLAPPNARKLVAAYRRGDLR